MNAHVCECFFAVHFVLSNVLFFLSPSPEKFHSQRKMLLLVIISVQDVRTLPLGLCCRSSDEAKDSKDFCNLTCVGSLPKLFLQTQVWTL